MWETQIQTLKNSFCEGLKPEPILSYVEWAREKFYLPPNARIQGLIDFSYVPYLIEPLEMLSWTSPIKQEFTMKGIQIAWTTKDEIIAHANVDIFRKPFLMYFPKDDLASDFVKTRFDVGIENNPYLKGRLVDVFSKKDKNTIGLKMLPGGIPMKFVGGVAEGGYRSFTAAVIIMDDIDGFPKAIASRKGKRISEENQGQGNPIDLALNRKNARFGEYKFSASGSPTDEETSLIYEYVKKYDLRYYRVKCPFCGQSQVLNFWRFRPPKKTRLKMVTMECLRCNRLIPELYKFDMMQLENGAYWAASQESEDPFIVSRQISSAYSLLGYTWNEMYKDFESASEELEQGKPGKMITFYNTKLGLPWKNRPAKKRIKHSELYKRRLDYKRVPKEAIILTCAVDVQNDRVETLVGGHTENGDIYCIEYLKTFGDTSIEYGQNGSLYNWIEQYSKKLFDNELGQQPILQMVVDTGYNSVVISPFLMRMNENDLPVVGIFGGTGQSKRKMFVSEPTKNKYGLLQYEINVDDGKTIIDQKLKRNKIHFSKDPCFSENFFRGVVAEKFDEKLQRWLKASGQRKNEPFDLINYLQAGLHIYAGNRKIDWVSYKQWALNGFKDITGQQQLGYGLISEGIR